MIVDKIALAAGLVVGGLLASAPAYLVGKSNARAELELSAAKDALNRIEKLDENNAKFNTGTAHDRCVIFMHDSRLPISECD